MPTSPTDGTWWILIGATDIPGFSLFEETNMAVRLLYNGEVHAHHLQARLFYDSLTFLCSLHLES